MFWSVATLISSTAPHHTTPHNLISLTYRLQCCSITARHDTPWLKFLDDDDDDDDASDDRVTPFKWNNYPARCYKLRCSDTFAFPSFCRHGHHRTAPSPPPHRRSVIDYGASKWMNTRVLNATPFYSCLLVTDDVNDTDAHCCMFYARMRCPAAANM